MAVNSVKERLRRVSAALDGAGVAFAVIGGHAVADCPDVRRPLPPELLSRLEQVEGTIEE